MRSARRSKDHTTEWCATAKHIPALQPSTTGPPHNLIFSVVLCQKCPVSRLGISLLEHWGRSGKSDYSSTLGLSGSQELQNCHITAQKKAQEVAGNNAIPNKSCRETRIVTERKIKKVFLNTGAWLFTGDIQLQNRPECPQLGLTGSCKTISIAVPQITCTGIEEKLAPPFTGQDLKEEALSAAGYFEILLNCKC